jgi:hypothetical protein
MSGREDTLRGSQGATYLLEEQGARPQGGELTKRKKKEDLKVIEGFRDRLIKAWNATRSSDDSKNDYDALYGKLTQGDTPPSGTEPKIALKVAKPDDSKTNVGTAVERAIREKVGDDLARSSMVDVLIDGNEIEVTHTAGKTESMKTGSRGLTKDTNKWYLFVEGGVKYGESKKYTAWLVRSDKLSAEIDKTPAGKKIDVDDPDGEFGVDDFDFVFVEKYDNAIKEIEAEIDKIKRHLARQIYYKSRGMPKAPYAPARPGERNSMTLEKQVGGSSVRLEPKFEGPATTRRDTSESLLRCIVREQL